MCWSFWYVGKEDLSRTTLVLFGMWSLLVYCRAFGEKKMPEVPKIVRRGIQLYNFRFLRSHSEWCSVDDLINVSNFVHFWPLFNGFNFDWFFFPLVYLDCTLWAYCKNAFMDKNSKLKNPCNCHPCSKFNLFNKSFKN